VLFYLFYPNYVDYEENSPFETWAHSGEVAFALEGMTLSIFLLFDSR
jgi:hypothetical protein